MSTIASHNEQERLFPLTGRKRKLEVQDIPARFRRYESPWQIWARYLLSKKAPFPLILKKGVNPTQLHRRVTMLRTWRGLGAPCREAAVAYLLSMYYKLPARGKFTPDNVGLDCFYSLIKQFLSCAPGEMKYLSRLICEWHDDLDRKVKRTVVKAKAMADAATD